MSSKISMKEANGLLLTIFVISFIFSFTMWGIDKFDVVYGLKNLFITAVLVSIALLGKLFVQKRISSKFGFDAKYKPWYVGLVLGFLVILVSNGKLIFLGLGVLIYSVVEHTRIGHRHPLSYSTMAWISVLGILTNIMLAAVFKILVLANIFNETVLLRAMAINLWVAIFGILPIPNLTGHMFWIKKPWWESIEPSEGLSILYHSRWLWVGTAVFILSCTAAILYLPTITGFVFAALFSALVWWIYYITVEQGL
jgi:hypothetical protein